MLGLPDGVRACLFDLDGVLTQTAKVHAAAWKQMFDAYLQSRAAASGDEFVPFDDAADYDRYVDGKPRQDGVRSFLGSRGIELPAGTPDDPPDRETVARAGSRASWEWTASARPANCGSTAPAWWWRIWPTSSSSHDPARDLRGSSVGDPRDRPRPRRTGADGVGARALQRAHRHAREPGRGRAARHAGHLSERRLRGPPASVRGGGLRRSRGGPDGRQRHRRKAHPAARGRRALRRS